MKTLLIGLTIVSIIIGFFIYRLSRIKTESRSYARSKQAQVDSPVSASVAEHSSAVRKICEAASYELEITEYSNTEGAVGGYFATANAKALVSDAPGFLYDESGIKIALSSLFNSEKQAEFSKKFDELKQKFPQARKLHCEH
jgi:hypothetical protein